MPVCALIHSCLIGMLKLKGGKPPPGVGSTKCAAVPRGIFLQMTGYAMSGYCVIVCRL